MKVNGQTVFQNVATGQLNPGDIGLITHWARANFDDLRMEDYPPR